MIDLLKEFGYSINLEIISPMSQSCCTMLVSDIPPYSKVNSM